MVKPNLVTGKKKKHSKLRGNYYNLLLKYIVFTSHNNRFNSFGLIGK